MIFRVVDAALQDLWEIETWVTETFGGVYTSRTLDKLYKTFALLADFPEMGQARPDLTRGRVRFFQSKPYWIVYEAGDELVILRVYHAVRDLKRLNR